jgi:hypothetical protein
LPEGSLADDSKQFVLKQMQELSDIDRYNNGNLSIKLLRSRIAERLAPSDKIEGLATEEKAIAEQTRRNLDNYTIQGPSRVPSEPAVGSANTGRDVLSTPANTDSSRLGLPKEPIESIPTRVRPDSLTPSAETVDKIDSTYENASSDWKNLLSDREQAIANVNSPVAKEVLRRNPEIDPSVNEELLALASDNPDLKNRLVSNGEKGIRPIEKIQASLQEVKNAERAMPTSAFNARAALGTGVELGDALGRYVLDRTTAPTRAAYNWLTTTDAEKEAAAKEARKAGRDGTGPSRSMLNIYR